MEGLVDEDKVRDEAVIYKKTPLPEYHKRINEAAGDIAIRNPCLLTKRSQLLEAARVAVYESGYKFKKGNSRSKVLATESATTTPKRPKLNLDIREGRIKDLNEEISDISQRIDYKEKRVTAAANVKNFKACDEIVGEITELKSKRRSLQSELKEFKNKEKRAKKYRDSRSKD